MAKEELAAARRDEHPDAWHVKMRKRKRQNPGQEPIEQCLKMMRTTVELAPKGMKRSVENDTSWSRARKCIYWQVEWIRESNAGRSLSKVMGNKPIGEVYTEFLVAERRSRLTDEEKRLEKKLLAKEREKLAREARPDGSFGLSQLSVLQDSETGAWGCPSAQSVSLLASGSSAPNIKSSTLGYHFYLHRPKTPSSFPKVLAPLNPNKSLERLLRQRLVLEFPTIYVLKAKPDALPEDEFMLEKDFLSATGQPPWQDSDTEMLSGSDQNGSSEEETSESETSSSGSDSDEIMEDGEVAGEAY